MSGVISTIALTAVAATGVYSVIQNTKAQEAQQAANQTALDTQTKYQDASLVQQQEVFPMHVGVFLTGFEPLSERCCLPHARGGVSSFWEL